MRTLILMTVTGLTSLPEECVSAPDPGLCRAAFRMFYYNVNTATCQPFIYGGCHGNQNRHGSMEECMARCSRYGEETRLCVTAFIYI